MTFSFAFHTDPELSAPLSDNLVSEQNFDGSSEPNDFVLYLGSESADRKVQADADPGADQIEVSVTHSVPEWAPEVWYGQGERIRANGRYFEAMNSGTSGETEPDLLPGLSAVTGDGDITWKNVGPEHDLSEVRLATTEAGLETAVPGEPLLLGAELLGDPANAQPIHVRVDDATHNVLTIADLRIQTNQLREYAL